MAQICMLVYVTVPNTEVADKIARTGINQGLAACANVVSDVRSYYRWEGKLEVDPEVLILFKTTEGNLAGLMEAVRSLHPYEVPCITALPITGGDESYLAWVRGD